MIIGFSQDTVGIATLSLGISVETLDLSDLDGALILLPRYLNLSFSIFLFKGIILFI